MVMDYSLFMGVAGTRQAGCNKHPVRHGQQHLGFAKTVKIFERG
jgi:hypothetical protein